MSISSPQELRDKTNIGSWLLFVYGFDKEEFCVLKKTEENVLLGNRKWLVSGAMWLSWDYVHRQNGEILCHGKKRWWHSLTKLIGLGDLVFPYSSPRGVQ